MNYIKVTTTYPTGGTLLPNAFVDNYMIRANGEYIKVYIYLLRMVSDGANFSIPCLADVLELLLCYLMSAIGMNRQECKHK